MAQLVLAGRDWKTRALLRAQLLEEGVEVEAYESLQEALPSLGPALPALLIADLVASDDPGADIHRLADWTSRIPTWVIASRSPQVASELEGRGFARIFFRPVDMGELVRLVKDAILPPK